MAPESRGQPRKAFKVVKPKKKRLHTATTKQFRYKSFNDRISDLKIDPIRQRRNVESQHEITNESSTYFGQALDEWRDKDMSAVFTAFAKEVAPLSDSLHVVLLNRDNIMDHIDVALQKEDVLSMEALLSVLSAFAHDLDVRFEKYFSRAVERITSIASRHADAGLIEQCFTCLAWLFKYLSRLLVPDLRPLYDLLAPYLGRISQKPYIVRFVAEALSFLMRKAATGYERNNKPLDILMQHILEDCRREDIQQEGTHSLLQQGAMTLLTEAVKGVQDSIHSSGVAVIASLMKFAEEIVMSNTIAASNLVSGVLTSLIHYCNRDTFAPVLNVVLEHVSSLQKANGSNSHLAAVLLFTIASVRKGSRISDWKRFVASQRTLWTALSQNSSQNTETRDILLSSIAVSLQSAPVDAVLSARSLITDILDQDFSQTNLPFCDMFVRLGFDRFESFILPAFQNRLSALTPVESVYLCSLLPRLLHGSQTFKIRSNSNTVVTVLDSLENFAKTFQSSGGDINAVAQADIWFSGLSYIALSEVQNQRVQAILILLVRAGLTETALLSGEARDFALGIALQQLLRYDDLEVQLVQLWPRICENSKSMLHLPIFWKNLLQYVRITKSLLTVGPHNQALEEALVRCLSSASHDIREAGLDILAALYRKRGLELPTALSIAILIESTPIKLDTTRSISMNIRKLAPAYDSCHEDELMVRAIPTYCFGLLHLQLGQAWDDATVALSSMVKSKRCEDVVMELIEAWLESRQSMVVETEDFPNVIDVETDGFKVFSDFQCPNLAKMDAIKAQVFCNPEQRIPGIIQQLKADHKQVPLLAPNARAQALSVLQKIPNVAEKRSRVLVPVLLRWTDIEPVEGEQTAESAARWSRKDQKLLLGLFAQFVNPRVLYKSQEVFRALLELCKNGDVEIQRSALKAVLSWKTAAITKYEENLLNLLDESRFREELSVFLRPIMDEEGIRGEDEAELMPVLLRLLYGRAIAGGKEGQAGRRQAVFLALSRFGEHALTGFVDIALGHHDGAGKSAPEDAPVRQQLGMLNMVNDMLDVLGAEFEPIIPRILSAVCATTIAAASKLDGDTQANAVADASLLRAIRQTGVQCLGKLYGSTESISDPSYQNLILQDLVLPRLPAFPQENAQSVSGMLRLFAAWGATSQYAQAFEGDGENILKQINILLQSVHSKDEVRFFILQDFLRPLLEADTEDKVLRAHIPMFVGSIASIIEHHPSKDILFASIKLFTLFAERIHGKEEAISVCSTCRALLTQPGKAVPPSIKENILKTLLPILNAFEIDIDQALYDALCALFSRLSSPDTRMLLSQVLSALVQRDIRLAETARICADLNAQSSRLDQPDLDSHERAFNEIFATSSHFDLQQWLPILHNCLFYIRDSDDRVNRTSSSHALRLFVDAAAEYQNDGAWKTVLDHTVLGAIEYGMRESSELVRAELLGVMDHVVLKFPAWDRVSDMAVLRFGDDEEASFFTNVLQIQHHRRLRALRRVAETADTISSTNASRLMLPLLEHFVFDQAEAESDAGRTLADQTVVTIGAIARSLKWSAWRAVFQRYIGYLKSKEDLEKTVLRLLGAMVDGLKAGKVTEAQSKNIIQEQLPPLLEYLHSKDESTVDRRMPLAVTIVKLLLVLPEAEMLARLPAVLTDVCHVLRSRSQEARDQTRRSLAAMLALCGPNYFQFVLKELRSALQRGYQLHVLSYTVHSLLVSGNFEHGAVDECLPDIVRVIMDDIFGATGQEKDAEDYKSSMKEVKSSKSYDTMELLARSTPITKLNQLVRPIADLLADRLELKMVKKVDDLLTRLRKGLDLNPASQSRDMLTFCWQMVNRLYDVPVQSLAAVEDERRKRYIVRPEKRMQVKTGGSAILTKFKLPSFALNLLRKVLRRHDDLQTSQNMAGFLPMAGDLLIEGHEDVKLASMRFLSTIMKVDMPRLSEDAPVYIKEAVTVVKAATSMTTDAAKAAFELVTAVLREKRHVAIAEKDVAILIKKIQTDVDEPDGQGLVYRFLRTVLARKIVITEVYEVMDDVRNVMITNPDRSVRESARGAYSQFIMEYPQSKERWRKQTAFLVGNLRYEHAAGRQSAMEFLHQMLGKISADVLEDLSPRIFVPLLPVITSDVDQTCRDMAGLLIGKLFDTVPANKLSQFVSMMFTWLETDKKTSIKVGALKCWGVLIETKTPATKQLEKLSEDLQRLLTTCLDDESTVTDSELIIEVLRTFTALMQHAPATALAHSTAAFWRDLEELKSFDDRIRAITAALLGSLYNDIARSNAATADGLSGLPLTGSGGLELGAEDLRRLSVTSLRDLASLNLSSDEQLISHLSRNMVFLGRCFSANEILWNDHSDEESELEGDESGSDTESRPQHPALSYLFARLSSIIKQDRYSTVARSAALQCQVALINQVESIPNLTIVLRPLYALTDPLVPKPPDDAHKALTDKAHEALDVVQKKIGAERYVSALATVRTAAKTKRDERRQKRRIDAVAAPEKWAKEKKRKHETKKLKQKLKGAEARGNRRGW